MKKQRLTLVELVIAIALLITIVLVIYSSFSSSNKVKNSNDYGMILDKIAAACDTYLSNNLDLLSPLYLDTGYLKIPVKNLINSGLLASDLVNPNNGSTVGVKTTDFVLVTIDVSGKLKFAYNAMPIKEGYLESQSLSLIHGEAFNCQDLSVYQGEWQSPSLRYVDASGKVNLDLPIESIIMEVTCNVNLMVPKQYTITYKYQIPGTKEIKSYKRSALVLPSMDDIINITVTPALPQIKLGEPLEVTVFATNRRGDCWKLEPGEYTFSNDNTDRPGTFNSTIMVTKVNSDSTIAKIEISYQVIQ